MFEKFLNMQNKGFSFITYVKLIQNVLKLVTI